MLVTNGGRVADSLTTPGITHVITTSWMDENTEYCEVTPSWVLESCKRGLKVSEYGFWTIYKNDQDDVENIEIVDQDDVEIVGQIEDDDTFSLHLSSEDL